ncbi:peptidyl-prolyl cis-trans isomerase E-like isoform X2 [Vulpes vulpes]|uniref:Peptidyl-prolyl cis-trans isomerase n=1 Tax=Vulpes vulpes TaxID=9627 RepID=A0ABM4XP80_VULVU
MDIKIGNKPASRIQMLLCLDVVSRDSSSCLAFEVTTIHRPALHGQLRPQFFLTCDKTDWLDGKHVVFGEVTEGLDVLRQIEAARTGSRSRR